MPAASELYAKMPADDDSQGHCPVAQDIFDLLASKGLLGEHSARLHRAIAFVSIGGTPVGWLCALALGCLFLYFTYAPPPLVWSFGAYRLKRICWLFLTIAMLSIAAMARSAVGLMFSEALREAVQRHAIPRYKGKVRPELLEQFDATYMKVTRMYDTDGSLFRAAWLVVGPCLWLFVAFFGFQLWDLPMVSLPWLTAPLLMGSISIFGDMYLVPMVLVPVLSLCEAYNIFEEIRSFDPNSANRDPLFWQKMLNKHLDMADRLERLWAAAAPMYSAYFAVLGSFMILASVGLMTVGRNGTASTGIILLLAWVGLSVAALLFTNMAVLAKISTICSSISCLPNYTGDGGDTTTDFHITSIRRAILEKSGISLMTREERMDQDRLIDFVRFYPTGVRIYGTLIDTALILRLAFPAFTGFTTLVSYALAESHIGYDGNPVG